VIAQLFPVPAGPSCDTSTISFIVADANAACPAGFSQAQCPAACALAVATIAYGDCRYFIVGFVDQTEQDPPNGIAETVQRQLAACLSENTPAELATAASTAQGCAIAGGSGEAIKGGHRRLQGHEHQENEALLEAFAVGDGSICALATKLLAPPPLGSQHSCNDDDVQILHTITSEEGFGPKIPLLVGGSEGPCLTCIVAHHGDEEAFNNAYEQTHGGPPPVSDVVEMYLSYCAE
jgi:hypothetical protein